MAGSIAEVGAGGVLLVAGGAAEAAVAAGVRRAAVARDLPAVRAQRPEPLLQLLVGHGVLRNPCSNAQDQTAWPAKTAQSKPGARHLAAGNRRAESSSPPGSSYKMFMGKRILVTCTEAHQMFTAGPKARRALPWVLVGQGSSGFLCAGLRQTLEEADERDRPARHLW